MLTLYTVPESLYCAKTRILLRHKGLVWEERAPPGGYGSDAYKEIVPSGSLPAMIDGDLMLADSEAIAEYLNELYPEPPMLPSDIADRALVRQHGRFHDTRLEPAVRMLFPLMRPAQRSPEAVATALAAIRARLAQRARGLAGNPGVASGGMLSLGDCGYPITFRWIERLSRELGDPVVLPAEVSAYNTALSGQSAVAEELAVYASSMDAWVRRVTVPT
ncbi:MAG: glutathione S-transferase family protein [Pseudomonadota bacterium]